MALPPLDETYRNAWLRITDVAGQLDGPQLGLTVPATPEWTVHDVVAHLAGIGDDATRTQFSLLASLFAEARAAVPGVDTLSMGMSDDLEIAVACGSTMVRVGTALFGLRQISQGVV